MAVPPSLEVVRPDIVILGGGPPESFVFQNAGSDDTAGGWLVCGLGMRFDGKAFRTLGRGDWGECMSGNHNQETSLRDLEGHFVAVRWENAQLDIYCDSLGLRTAYVAETEHFFAVSTRLDWVVALMNKPELNLDEMASQWLLTNSFSNGSIVKGVVRSLSSSHISIAGGKVAHTWHEWKPKVEEPFDVVSVLKEASTFLLRDGRRLSLGLSGGVDSRTLLALLSGSNGGNWAVHTMGDSSDPDISIAERLSESMGITHRTYIYHVGETETVDSLVNSLKEYCLLTQMTDSIFGYQKLGFFSEMHSAGFWMIDGGFGELFRRSYGNKMLLAGKKAVISRDASRLMEYLYQPRSPIFNQEIHNMFLSESRIQLEKAVQEMPEDPKRDPGTWIDLFHIRYRLRNSAPSNQAAYDSCIPNYMPYVQPSLMSAYLTLPSGMRRNNKLSRQIMVAGPKELRDVHFSKNGTTYPFFMSRHALAPRLMSIIHRKIYPRANQADMSFRLNALLYLKEYLMDKVASSEARTCPYYDHQSLAQRCLEFYAHPNESDGQFIEDWLKFDFWREITRKRLSQIE